MANKKSDNQALNNIIAGANLALNNLEGFAEGMIKDQPEAVQKKIRKELKKTNIQKIKRKFNHDISEIMKTAMR